MDFYHSFWEHGHNRMDDYLYNLHKLSVFTCLKSHGNIHLITTQKGAEFLGDLPYTSIEIFEEDLDVKFASFWAISKIMAYKQAANKGKPFLHIDYDVFLFKPLPEDFLDAEICAQSLEPTDIDKYEKINELRKNAELTDYWDHYHSDLMEYNTGVFGGNNLDIIKSYCNEIIRIVQNPKNFHIFDTSEKWKDDKRHNEWFLSTVFEQCFIVAITNFFKANVKLLFNEESDYDKTEELGYTHLMGAKYRKDISDAVQKKLLNY